MSKSRLLVAVISPWASEKLDGPISDLAKRLDAEVIVGHVAQLQDEDEHESDANQRGEETLKLLTEDLRATGVEAEGVMLFSNDVPKALLLYVNPGSSFEAGLKRRRQAEGELWNGRGQFAQ